LFRNRFLKQLMTTTLFVDHLTVIDASRLDEIRGLVGESWIVDVELEGDLNNQGMILDFGDVKREVKQTIDRHFDHKLLLPARHPECAITHQGGSTEVRFRASPGNSVYHRSPSIAVREINAVSVNADSLAADIAAELKPGLPANIENLRIRLHHEATGGAVFHYSHGLRQHAGACQRIAHGHRSRIEIFKDGMRDSRLESQWAERWKDIYIGAEPDLLERPTTAGISCRRFGYTTHEGEFELELPERHCYLIEKDSTVENLATHVADYLKRDFPDSDFRVRIFEGINKGAISEA
jgi:6-pyruvoyl-tetrahydropterin synthase